jgi:hypothetical protein
MVKKVVVIHWCGVKNVGTDNEDLTAEWKMRVFGALQSIIQDEWDKIVYVTWWKPQENQNQQQSEAHYMGEYLRQIQKDLWIKGKIEIREEWESTDTFENIQNTITKTKEELFAVLKDSFFIDVYTSSYHTRRAWLVRKNQLKSTMDKKPWVQVKAADKQEFSDPTIATEYKKILQEYHQERSKTTLSQKLRWWAREIIWTAFAYLWMDKILSYRRQKIFKRKKK